MANTSSLVDRRHVSLDFILDKGYTIAAMIETHLSLQSQGAVSAIAAGRGYAVEHGVLECTDAGRVGTERAWERFFHTKILGRGLVWADRLYRENFTEVEDDEEEAPSAD